MRKARSRGLGCWRSGDFSELACFAVVRGHDGAREGRAYAVAAHADLGGLGDGLAGAAAVDDVALGEALGTVQLTRREHAQPAIHDGIGLAVDHDQAHAVLGGDRVHGICAAGVLATPV